MINPDPDTRPKMTHVVAIIKGNNPSNNPIFPGSRITHSKTLLGKGGFAWVFMGRLDNRDVAVKRIEIVENYVRLASKREEIFLTENAHSNILKLFHAEETELFRQVPPNIR